MPVTIGLISDTHGLLRPEVASAFQGVEFILHAGDVGGADVLTELRMVAPVHAVYGNCDDPWTPGLDATYRLTSSGWSIVVTHGHQIRRLTPESLLRQYDDADIIVYGHTHRPLVHRDDKRIVINPGAAGPGRFDIRPSVARLTLFEGRADVEHLGLS